MVQALRRLRAAVKKLRFLLSFDVTDWLTQSASGKRSRRLVHMGSQGLLDVVSNPDTESSSSCYYDAMATSMSPGSAHNSAKSSPFPETLTRRLSSTSSGLLRTESGATDPEEVEDINRRAQEFIDNFRRHLRREISLDLAYSRTSSIETDTRTRS